MDLAKKIMMVTKNMVKVDQLLFLHVSDLSSGNYFRLNKEIHYEVKYLLTNYNHEQIVDYDILVKFMVYKIDPKLFDAIIGNRLQHCPCVDTKYFSLTNKNTDILRSLSIINITL